MPAASDFRLYHGNDLDVLAAVLGHALARHDAGLDPLVPDTILIPQPSMRRWLQNTLARMHGIAANLRFLTPGEFVREALAANLGDDDAAVADAGQLRWRLWDRLGDASLRQAPALAPLRALLDGTRPERAAWNLAGDVALAFEKYQAWRRDWLLDWDRGAQPGDWQAELWRQATRGGGHHRGIRLTEYLARFGEGADAASAGLPRRLFAFCCQNVSPDVLRVIASQARAGTLHFFFVSPVEGWWGDLQTARERLRDAPDDSFALDEENPLLRANGAAGRDFVRLLFSYEVAHPSWEQAIYVPPDPGARTGLLHHMQRDLLARRAPAASVAPQAQDASLQFHRCHTRLREVQVLHDRLRALLDADPTLQPRDIAVLTPDIDRYAPNIHAVFGALQGDRRHIPYAVADGSALATHPLIDMFLQVLALPESRFATSEVLTLLAQPAVAERFGLDAGDLDALRTWLDDAGARWALDARHRAAHDAPAEPAYTWAWALDRILLGHAGGDASMIDGIAAWPELEGSAIATLDSALQALRTLARLQREFGRAMPPSRWLARIAQALDDLLPANPPDPDTRRALDVLRRTLDRFGDETRQAEVERNVPPDVVRAWFESALREDQTRQPFLSGGVNFARMVPMRLIPFRVICLIGMNDDAFPRRDPAGGINRIAHALRAPTRRLGDRSIRDDDRLLFLQLFAAASDVFYLSWLGTDPRSGETRPASVVVAELVDLAAATLAGGDADALVVAHPLQPFSAEAFGAGDARRGSYRHEWRAAADRTSTTHALPPFAAVLPPPLERETHLDHAVLLRDLLNPSRAWLERRLGLRLSARGDDAADDEPFDRNEGLHRYGVRETVFEALLCDAGPPDMESLRRQLLAQARIAPGAAGRHEVALAFSELQPLVRQWRAPQRGVALTLPFELDIGDVRLHGNLTGAFDSGLHQWSLSRNHGRTQLRLGIEALIWAALGQQMPVHRLVFGEAPQTLPAFGAADAFAALERLLRVHADALREVLPWGPQAGCEYMSRIASGKSEEMAFSCAQAIWEKHEGHDPWVALALRGGDPFCPGNTDAAARFQSISVDVFGALLQPEMPA
jgi:exodeoxyribonuclease V gamma subunit